MKRINLQTKVGWLYTHLSLLLILVAFQFSHVKAQIIINEILPGGTVELKNVGNNAVNVNNYWLCNFPDYQRIGNSGLECGALPMIMPGEIIAVNDFNAISSNNGEIGLYTSQSFASSAAMIDYVEWGFSGHQRSSVAVNAGIWSTGDFVPAFGSGESLAYSGSGNSAQDWTAGAPTICAENVAPCTAEAGIATTSDNTTICVDGNPDPININISGAGSGVSDGWIITDLSGNILGLPMAPPFDLDGAGVGTCVIYYIQHDANLEGNTVGNNLSNLSGCYDLSNGINVYRQVPDGGTVTSNGQTTLNFNVGEVVFDVQHTTVADMLNYWYIITDQDDNILGWHNPADGPTIDASGAPPGECHIWGWSFNGSVLPVMGENISTLSNDDCEAISNNFITVIRTSCSLDAGSIATSNGDTEVTICVDGVGDPINVNTIGATPGTSNGWIITDLSGNILGLPMAPPFDLDGAGVGTCIIYALTNEANVTGNMVGNNIDGLGGCFDLSNGITVYRQAPDAGMVSLTNGETTYTNCAGDIVFDVQNTSVATMLNYWYVITDDNDNILGWHNAADGPTIDASGAPPGECRIWGWSFNDLGDPVMGENISTLADDGCEAISSNWVTIYRETPDGGMVSLPNGETEYTGCAGNIILEINHSTTAPNLNYWYIITDDLDNIVGWHNTNDGSTLDLSGAPAGVCHIWGWSHNGNNEPTMGNHISTLNNEFCEATSTNWITVNREILDGGTVALADGTTTYTACAGDIVFDMTHSTSSTAFNYIYVITDVNDNVLGTHDPADGPTIDASGAPAGECHIWGWNSLDAPAPVMGENISTLGDDACEAISTNFITVNREEADGGSITVADGTTSYAACAGDIILDVTHATSASNLGYWYIITDDNDNILGAHNTLDGPTLDLSGAPAGECHIWGWSSDGANTPVMGENISTLDDDACESISADFITVYRETPDGGTLDSSLGTEFSICIDDEADPFDVTFTTNAPNLSYWLVITDNLDNILGFQTSDDGTTLDLNGADVGVCRVWGWNFKDLGEPVIGENISSLSDDFCEDISDNFIEITRVDVGAPCLVGTDDFGSAEGINIFPNPANDHVYVAYNGLESQTGVMTLVDITGKTIQKVTLTRQDDLVELDITNVSNGYYFIRIDSDNRTTAKKLVVVK